MLLKKLFHLVVNRWTLSVLGLLILGVLIWLFGPLFAFAGRAPLAGEAARLGTVAVIVAGWFAFQIVTWLRRRQRNREMLASLAPTAAPPDPRDLAAKEEREALAARFTDAIATLKTARLGGRGGRRYLYQLPWYLLVGPPGSGKTTALANSGLKFPLERKVGKGAVRGVGGTRNCDWFFTDEAVLIDTAGRYTTQDSDEQVDRSAWQDFLQLLRKHRPSRPVDGLIVAFSAADLIKQDAEERQRHARAVSARIEEAYAALEVRAPVYVVFTKCDLIAGFNEFFSGLRSEEREQVWGITFDLQDSRQPERAISAFPGDFDALIDRLTGRQLPRIEEARSVSERGSVLLFPQQMALLGPAAEAFLAEAFAPSRYQAPVLLRGVYFTSATQEGSPIDRVLGAVSAQFGLEAPAPPAFSGHGVSYFLTRLLRDVIFREAGLVAPTSRLARNRPSLMLAGYAGALLLAVIGVGALLTSYLGNLRLIEQTQAKVDEIARQQASSRPAGVEDALAFLTALRDLPGGYAARDAGAPLHLGLGLYQGGRLGAAAQTAYRRALNTLMVPPLMARMEQQISESAGNTEYLYQALKFYLMMTTPEQRDPDLLEVWIARDWEARHPGAAAASFRQSFREHLDALLEEDLNPVPAANAPLVAQARQALVQLPLASRVYAQLKAEQHAERTNGWTLPAFVSADDLRYFRRRSNAPFTEGIPRLYTVDGYQQVFVAQRAALVEQAVDEAWVMGRSQSASQADEDRSALERKVEELYLADYVRLWAAFLDDIEIEPGSNVELQADLVRAIMQPDSPIKSVLTAVAGQTALAQEVAAREQQEMDPGKLQRFREHFERLLRPADPAVAQAPGGTFVDPALKVDQRFRQMNALVRSDGKAPPRIDAVLADLRDLYDYLVQALHEKTVGPEAVQSVGETVARGNAVLGRIESLASAQPEPLQRWLSSVAAASRVMTVDRTRGAAQQQVKEAWASSVAPDCIAAMAGRYPFDRTSPLGVNLIDFTRVLGPGGTIDAFAQEFILPFADTSVRPWRWRRDDTGLRGISNDALRMFEQAGTIRAAFFGSGSSTPGFGFELEPVSLDRRASKVAVEIGDQRITYQHGPRRPTRVQWPNGSGARITFTTAGLMGQTLSTSKPGPWAWLQLLDSSQVRRGGSPDRFRVMFEVNGYRAEFDVRSDSVINPFFLPELERFRCRERL